MEIHQWWWEFNNRRFTNKICLIKLLKRIETNKIDKKKQKNIL